MWAPGIDLGAKQCHKTICPSLGSVFLCIGLIPRKDLSTRLKFLAYSILRGSSYNGKNHLTFRVPIKLSRLPFIGLSLDHVSVSKPIMEPLIRALNTSLLELVIVQLYLSTEAGKGEIPKEISRLSY